MGEFINLSYNLVNAIISYKKKKDISKLHMILICISDRSAEDFAELILRGYFERIIRKKKVLNSLYKESKKKNKLIMKIKKEVTSYFITLNEIFNTHLIPISDLDEKRTKLLDEFRNILNQPTANFYNNYILEYIKAITKQKVKEKISIDKNLLLLNEEEIILGYFLLCEELYGSDSFNKYYYSGPFYKESFPSNYEELNKRHDNLIYSIYPKNSNLNILDVIKKLQSKNLLIINEGQWSKSGKTFWQSTISADITIKYEKLSENIISKISALISNLIKEVSLNKNMMQELLLLEENIPEFTVERLFGEEFQKLITLGFKNQQMFKDTWRVKFNPTNNMYNSIEEELSLNKLELIEKINQKKRLIIDSLSELEKHYLSLISSDKTIIGKHMGTNYSEQTIKKYEKKISEIEINYDNKTLVLAKLTGKEVDVFEEIYKNLKERGIIWEEPEGFPGYLDVHQILLKSFINIEPVKELKELLNNRN